MKLKPGLLLTLLATTAAAPLPALHWRELGPFRGGWATMVAGIPTQPDTFYFAAAGGGVWRTENAGRTWQPLFQHGPAAPVGAIAIAPSDPKILYIGTGQPEPRYDIGSGRGIFRSNDGGKTWTSLGLADTRYIGKIWIDPKDPDTVLVGALGHVFGPDPNRGLYRSTDGGKTWTQTLQIDDSTGIVDIAADPADPKHIIASAWQIRQYPWQSYFNPIAGHGSALYESTDGGVTWQRMAGKGWPTADLGRIGIATTSTKQGLRIYATIDAGKNKEATGLYRSDDDGKSWTRANPAPAFTNWYTSRITVAPNDPDTLYTVGQSIRRCTDAGAHCTIIKGAPGGDDYHYIWINPLHPDHVITGSDQGAVVSVDDFKTWSSWYNQPTAQLYHLAADNRFPYWIYSGQQDSGTVGIASRSDYGAIGWRDWHPIGGDERDCDIPDPVDPNIIYASGLGGRVTKWDARTGQVQNITPWPVSSYAKRPTEVKYHYLWVTPMVASRTGPPALYLGAQVLFRTKDRGASWQIISPDLTGKDPNAKNCGGNPTREAAKECGYGSIAAIEPSPTDANTIWIGTDDGIIQKTEDGGAHWQNVTPPSIPLWGKVASLDLSAKQPGTAYAAIDNQRLDDYAPHFLRTHDNGKTWQDISNGLPPDHPASVLRSDPDRPGLLYAGTDNAVFVSFDDGDHWQPLQQNLPTAWVRDLLVHDNDLIAATEGRGIWVLDDLSPLREINADLAKDEAHLFKPALATRVHPNNNADTPFPPETPQGENPPPGAIIDYYLGANIKGPVTLDIKDANGDTIRHYTSESAPKPVHAERYFEKGWLRPETALPASPGMHRWIWDLRAERPSALTYTYSIAATWGRDDPALPLGPWAVPGTYTIVLHADGHDYTAPLKLREDPRIHVSLADLQASLALSNRIAEALSRAYTAEAERDAVLHAIAADKKDDTIQAIGDTLNKPAAPDTLTFETADGILSGIETDLESIDAAPTEAQYQVVEMTVGKLDKALQAWSQFKADQLPKLNATLEKLGRKPVSLSAATEPDEQEAGEDLP